MKRIIISLILVTTLLGFTLQKKIYAQVNVQDSLALVALYNTTDGVNWTCNCNQNWLTGQVSQWQGITVESNRVVSIDLSSGIMACSPDVFCNLSGSIPSEIGTLTELTNLELSNNPNLAGSIPSEINNLSNLINLKISNCSLIGSVPQFDNLTNIQTVELNYNKLENLPILPILQDTWAIGVTHNKLTFEDLEPNIAINIYYSPQDSVNNNFDTTIYLHDTIAFKTTVGGSQNLYQWYHNGSVITGATDSIYVIYNATPINEGVYSCAVTNNIVPLLTLWRRTFHVHMDTLNNIDDNNLLHFNISVSDNNIEIHTVLDNSKAVLYTSNGKFLLSINLIRNNQNKIALNKFPKGILFLKIHNNKNVITQKIVNL